MAVSEKCNFEVPVSTNKWQGFYVQSFLINAFPSAEELSTRPKRNGFLSLKKVTNAISNLITLFEVKYEAMGIISPGVSCLQ